MKNGWFVSYDTLVQESKLPHWMGQITLKGMATEKVNTKEIGYCSICFSCGLVVRFPRRVVAWV